MIRNFSIGKKILLGFSALILLYLVLAWHGYSDMNEIRALTEQIVPLSSRVISLQEFAISLEFLEKDVDRFFTVSYKENQEKANEDLEKMLSITRSLEKNADNNSMSSLQEMERILSEVQINLNYLANLEHNSTNSREINEKRILVYELINKGRQKNREFLLETTNQIRINVLNQERVISNITKEFLILGISLLAFGIILSLITSRSISRPVKKLKKATNEVGRGNWNINIEVQSNDEIGELACAFNEMIKELQRTTVSRNYVDNIIKSMIETLVVAAPDGTIQTVNKATCDLLGYRAEELIGQPVDAVFVNELNEIIKRGSIRNIEKNYLTKDGRKIPMLFSGSVMHYDDGSIQGMVCAAQDITERKRAEERIIRLNRMYSVLSNINQAIVRIRDQQKLLEEACRIAVEHGLFRMAWIGMFDSDTHELRPVAKNGFVEGFLDYQLSQRTIISEEKYRSFAAFPLRVGTNVAGMFNVYAADSFFFDNDEIHLLDELSTDISFALESIDQEKQRKRAEEQIRASLKEKEVLIREIHHRVKNNMQIIASLLRLQSNCIKEERYREILKESQNRIMSMSLIHEKLYQSKDMAKIDFKNYIRDVTKALFQSYGVDKGNIIPKINIEAISLGIDSAIPCGLIINELVTNSLKHAFPDAKEGEIEISLRPADENMIELTVRDNGIGIPDDVDFRNTKSLGLQLVAILTKQIHGEIGLNRDNGTEFKIKFSDVK